MKSKSYSNEKYFMYKEGTNPFTTSPSPNLQDSIFKALTYHNDPRVKI